MELQVKLEVFEGPLDLLLHLINKNKVDIYDIPIVVITDQYMEYIRTMSQENLNVMSEFLVMAATLLDIKSKMLLPKTEEETEEDLDPRSELVEQLLQYKVYKYMSLVLKDRQIDADTVFYKSASIPKEVQKYKEPINLDSVLEGVDLSNLKNIFQTVIHRSVEKVDPIRSKFGTIEKEEVSVEEKMDYVTSYLASHSRCLFSELLQGQVSKTAIVVTFLALLELMKTGIVYVEQNELFDDIVIVMDQESL